MGAEMEEEEGRRREVAELSRSPAGQRAQQANAGQLRNIAK